MTFSCIEPRCRWAAHNGPHPDLIHAVWWGCTKRPARPYEPGALVVDVHDPGGAPYPVDRCEWDSGTGWHVVVQYGAGQWGLVRKEPAHVRPATPGVGHVQPDIFELLEAV